MSLSLWELVTLLSKIALYASVATAIGGVFSSWLLSRHRETAPAIHRYTVVGCVMGIIASLTGFGAQVGAFADQGAMGMLDLTMMSILWQTSVGTAVALQMVGFLLVGVAPGWLLKTQKPSNNWANVLMLLGGLSLLAAFSQVGHFAERSVLGKAAISFHVLAMSLWMGSLYPLWQVSRSANLSEIQRSMERFGQVAAVIVGVLVASGILMATMLLNDFRSLFFTPYGQGLLIKLTLVGGLLLLAASNKWFTVPRLTQPGFSERLTRAVGVEIGVGTCIFIVTGTLTVVVGIE